MTNQPDNHICRYCPDTIEKSGPPGWTVWKHTTTGKIGCDPTRRYLNVVHPSSAEPAPPTPTEDQAEDQGDISEPRNLMHGGLL